MEDCITTIRKTESGLGILFGSMQSILTDDLCMQCTAAKFVCGYDPWTRALLSLWKTPLSLWPKIARKSQSNFKVMSAVFFSWPPRCNSSYICFWRSNYQRTILLTVLCHLQDTVRHKQPELWQSGDWLIHHDNAQPTHHYSFTLF